MALGIDFNVCLNNACATFTFSELTGAYSATNTTGWGAPNPAIGTITAAILNVTSPSGIITSINLLAQSFPSSNPSFEYDFTTISVGGYEDGDWSFLLYYTDGSNTYLKKHNYLFYCNSKCCVEKLLAKVKVTDCDCCKADEITDTYLKARVFLDKLKNAAECYQVDNFDEIKEILDKLCANEDCDSCN